MAKRSDVHKEFRRWALTIVATLSLFACSGDDSTEPPQHDAAPGVEASCESSSGDRCRDAGRIEGGAAAESGFDHAAPFNVVADTRAHGTDDALDHADHGALGDALEVGTDTPVGVDSESGTGEDGGRAEGPDGDGGEPGGGDADAPGAHHGGADAADAAEESSDTGPAADGSADASQQQEGGGGSDDANTDVSTTPDATADVLTDTGGDAGPVPALTCSGCGSGESTTASLCFPPAGPCRYDVPNATLVLRNGACAIESCYPGWADCDGAVANGCEQDITVPDHCGSCQNQCTPDQKCADGACVASCPALTSDCSGTCADLGSSPGHCNVCTTTCSAPLNYRATCSAGSCGTSAVCPAGSDVCGGPCPEGNCPLCRPLDSDPANCGACGRTCTVPRGGTASCVSGVCVPQCPPGTELCHGMCALLRSDPANCGACGTVCAGVCAGGTCEAAWSAIDTGGTPDDFVIDATSLYFTDSGNASVKSVNKRGGTAVPLATGQLGPQRIAQDGAYVYWSNATDGSIWRATKDGSAAAQMVVTSGVEGALAVDGTYVYWSGQNSGAYGLQRAAKDGSGAPSRLGAVPVTTPLVTLLVDDSSVYWGGAGDPNAVVNNVWQIDKTTGTVQGLGTSRGAMTMDAASLYITAGSTMLLLPHYVVALDKITHVWTTLYTIPDGSIGGYGELTVDETYVYRTGRGSYSTNDGISALARIIKCGTQQRSQTIANPITLTHLATDEAFAYGISGAAIVRIRKSPDAGAF